MPVEFVDSKGAKKHLKFVQNVSYNGEDYGPDYKNDTAEVDSRWAAYFLQNGSAIEAGGKHGPGGEAQTRDPEGEHRDPDLKKN